MNPTSKMTILIVMLFASMSMAYALPQITSFDIKHVFPSELQVTWTVKDDIGLLRVELYKENELIYVENTAGMAHSSLYQLDDDKSNHTFKLIAYNVDEQSSVATKASDSDKKAPVVTSSSKIVSKEKILTFTTDEKAYCKVGFSEDKLIEVSNRYEVNHSISLPFNQGLNRVLVKCGDENNNEMSGFSSIEFSYDITAPGKITNIKFDLDGEDKIISWDAASDNVGVAQYKIYNSAQALFTTEQTYWEVTTEDNTFFISAVDIAGNEGEKQEYNLGREVLLTSNTSLVDDKDVTVVKDTGNKNETTAQLGASSVSKLAWITFGILLLIYIGWRIYDYKTDKHGLRGYMRKRRKLREFGSL